MNVSEIIHKSKDLINQTRQNIEILKKLKEEKKIFSIPDIDGGDKNSMVKNVVYISPSSTAKSTLAIIAILAVGYFLYSISSLLILFFISLFFAATLDTAVDYLETKKIPRWVGVILLYIVIFTFIVLVLGLIIPIVIDQVSNLISNISSSILGFVSNFQEGKIVVPYIGKSANIWVLKTVRSINIEIIAKQILENFSGISTQLQSIAQGSLVAVGSAVGAGASVAKDILGFILSLILVLFLTFFMVTDKENLNSFFRSLFPPRYSKYIEKKIHEIQLQIGSWIRGQLILMFLMFVISLLGLLIIGLGEYGLTLALILGIGEFLPYVGPIIFLTVSLPIALNISLFTVLKVLILYSILQFIEGNILVPAVMQKAVGLSPIVVLLVIIVGFQFLGIIGAIIAIPVTTAVGIFIKDYISFQAKRN